jgi:hypothetical protein
MIFRCCLCFPDKKFSRRIKTEKDWYNIKIAETKISGIDFKFTNNQPNVNVNKIDFNGVEAIIFRSKFPKDDLSRKKCIQSCFEV